MNTPLRYGGETFYQASFEEGDQVSILQVVRNPAAITPYVACILVAAGLIVQFLTHLIGFAQEARATGSGTPRRRDRRPKSCSRRWPEKGVSHEKMAALDFDRHFCRVVFVRRAAPKPVNGFNVAGWGSLPVLLNGRVQPLDSVARNSLLGISGTSTLAGANGAPMSATEWLLEAMTKPELADQRKIFRVQHPDLAGKLGATTEGLAKFSFNDLTNQYPVHQGPGADHF